MFWVIALLLYCRISKLEYGPMKYRTIRTFDINFGINKKSKPFVQYQFSNWTNQQEQLWNSW